jgi:hypothetical protein
MYLFLLGKSITLDSLLLELRTKYMYSHGRTGLANLLKNIGFSYKKDNHIRALMEKPHVVKQRRLFLQKYIANLTSADKLSCVVLDETWVYFNGTVRRSWQDDDVRSVKRSGGLSG